MATIQIQYNYFLINNKGQGQLSINFGPIVEVGTQILKHFINLVRKNMDVNEHERLSNITLRHKDSPGC